RIAVSWSANSAISSAVSSSRARVAMRCTSARVRVFAMAVNSIRPAAVAGSWYPASPDALAREVDGYVEAIDPSDPIPRRELHAVMAPHAGLMFSGPVAAYAYKTAAAAGPFDAAVLVGPSHFAAFDGIALYPRGAFESPFGPAHIHAAISDELLAI